MRSGYAKREVIAGTTKKYYWVLVLCFLNWTGGVAQGCPACWAGYGSGDERFNKPLADLRLLYEKEGRAALPAFREALRTQNDPLVKQRAAGYIAELKDGESIPLLEQTVSELLKRVSFSTFGLGTPDFQTRLKIAHVLANLGSTGLADRIWVRYDRLDTQKKMEVPYLLNALNDPRLTERLLEILGKGEDHQLMLGALEVLGMGGSTQALPYLRSKIAEWERKKGEAIESGESVAPVIYYSILRIKAEQAISQIEERHKSSSGQGASLDIP